MMLLFIGTLLLLMMKVDAETLVNKDGLVVTTGSDVHSVTCYWKVLVTLDKPKTPTNVQLCAEHLINTIQDMNITATFRTSWLTRVRHVLHRIDRVPKAADSQTKFGRMKRGLLDFVGHLSNALFGTATENEIAEVRSMLSSVRASTTSVTHYVDGLVTVVNRTRENVIANRARLNEVTRRQGEINSFLERLNTDYYWTSSKVELLRVEMEVERILEDLELLTDAYEETTTVYHIQRGALEWGKLSEDILTIEQLKQILYRGKGQNMIGITPVEWYYRYSTVEPIWADDDTLVFRVALPLIGSKQYIRYNIESFPVPLKDNATVQLNVTGSYGYDTVTGDMFVMNKCTGDHPIVCDASVMYNSNGMLCARGIISGDVSNRDECPAIIRKVKNQTIISTLGLNNYIVVTWGELVVTRCSGRPEMKSVLKRGIHHILLNHTCTLRGVSWKIEGVRTHIETLHVMSEKPHKVKPFQLENLVHVTLVKFEKSNPLVPLSPVHSVSIGRLRSGQLQSVQWISGSDRGWLSWINFISILLLSVAIALLLKKRVWWVLTQCLCKKQGQNDVKSSGDVNDGLSNDVPIAADTGCRGGRKFITSSAPATGTRSLYPCIDTGVDVETGERNVIHITFPCKDSEEQKVQERKVQYIP